MSDHTIEEFWKPRLSVSDVRDVIPVKGWSYQSECPDKFPDTFTEAPLSLSSNLSTESKPESTPILIVSAPGAVGKSTLARRISSITGAVYIDLSEAEPVGGNFLSGGLFQAGLAQSWSDQKTTLLIDGLDEARFRVTQEAYEAFLSDVARLAKNRTMPVVLFGRTKAVEDAWLVLVESVPDLAVLEIGYYDDAAALTFAEKYLNASAPTSPHKQVAQRALALMLEQLQAQTANDGSRFAGYAPVLKVMAERVRQENNAAALVARLESEEEAVTLQSVVDAILEREHAKLEGMPFEDNTLADRLYRREEQLDRLAAHLLGLSPPDLPPMSPADINKYDNVLKTWVQEHPFLDGDTGTSSSVFDAAISARALQNTTTAEAALNRELDRDVSANPFLFEFYMQKKIESDSFCLPPEHVGIVYASLRSQLSLGETASLFVAEAGTKAEGEITLKKAVGPPSSIPFRSKLNVPFQLGAHVADVEFDMQHSGRVKIGPKQEVVLVAPVNIQCSDLSIHADKIIVEYQPDSQTPAVHLEAKRFDGSQVNSIPHVRSGARLSAFWPEVHKYPWTSFAVEPAPTDDPDVEEAIRRLRKLVISFRSHGKGRLGRYQGKIEHERMTKGCGKQVLNALVKEEVLSLENSFYFLSPDQLAHKVGVNYADCMAYRFGEKAVEFVRRALQD